MRYAVLRLPIVFTIQNNQYAYSTPNDRGEFNLSPTPGTRADGYRIPVWSLTATITTECYWRREAVDRKRHAEGPTLMEAVAFRRFRHAGHDPRPTTSRSLEDGAQAWMAQDPIPPIPGAFVGTRGLLHERARGSTPGLRTRSVRRIDGRDPAH